jgi:hypothetical protein
MREAMSGGKTPKKVMTPSSKRTGDTPAKKKVTVSQATIDKIKSQGMTAALKAAAAGGVSASYMEGVKRMYGAARVAKATSSRINEASKPKAYGANNMPAYRPASAGATKFDAKKAASTSLRGGSAKAGLDAGRGVSTSGMPGKGPAVKMGQAAKKKSGTTDPFARAVFGAGRAVGAAFTPDWKKKEAAQKAAAAKNKNK